ncbi:MAG TPA: M48 family metallopeptidase [Bacteroidales bacterium]|mgnify:CR=1 FL=1|nr:M48 family metallopeptidase [Bacteroidales bacterium]
MKRKNVIVLSVVSVCFALLIFISNCSTIPIIGRKQLTLLPESELVSMGITNYKGFLDTMPLSKDVKNTQLLNDVGSNISTAVETYMKDNGLEKRLKDFQWEYALVESNVVNAWCMPGGKICFYTGILPYTKDATGIAVVMGHEIAHAVARHGNERMTQQLLTVAGGEVLTQFIKDKPQQTQSIFLNVFSVGAQVGILLPYSRKHEYEADRLGLIFMAMAGYNPEEAIEFWTRMSEIGGAKPPAFLSTHPSDIKRIANMKKCLPEAMTYYKKNNK